MVNEKTLTQRKRLTVLSTESKEYAIAEVHLTKPTGTHGSLNEDALNILGASTNGGMGV